MSLPLPDEPLALRISTRELLEHAPEEGLRLIDAGEWITPFLWDAWGAMLTERGWDREQLRRVVVEYGNELRLWVMGERPWAHCIAGLAGRVDRRLPTVPERD